MSKQAPGNQQRPAPVGWRSLLAVALVAVVVLGVRLIQGSRPASEPAAAPSPAASTLPKAAGASPVAVPSPAPTPIPTPTGPPGPREIAEKTFQFLRSLREGATVHSIKVSGLDGHAWWLGDTAHVTAAAWRTLGDAGMLTWSDTPEVREALKLDLRDWETGADMQSEFWSLHQLYEAYLITHDDLYLAWFWNRIDLVERYAQQAYAKPEKLRGDLPSLAATLMRQFAQAARSLDDEHTLDLVQRLHQLPKDPAARAALRERKKEFIALAEKLRPSSRGTAQQRLPLLAAKPPLAQFSCWEQWANSALYSATHEERYLNEITKFMSALKAASATGKGLHFTNQQAVLACVHTLLELEPVKPEFGAFADELIAKYVMPSWDGPRAPVCIGDGGLISTIRDPGVNQCVKSGKSNSDSSWFVFLISKRVLHRDVVKVP